MKYFASNLKHLRLKAKLSQRELGALVGLNLSAVSSWERGESYPRLPDFATIAAYFKVTETDFLHIDLVEMGYRKNTMRESGNIEDVYKLVKKIDEKLTNTKVYSQNLSQ